MAKVRQRLALDRGTGIAVLLAGALSFLPFAFVSDADLSTSTIAALGGVFGLPAVLALMVLTARPALRLPLAVLATTLLLVTALLMALSFGLFLLPALAAWTIALWRIARASRAGIVSLKAALIGIGVAGWGLFLVSQLT